LLMVKTRAFSNKLIAALKERIQKLFIIKINKKFVERISLIYQNGICVSH
jgi:hypothetical protein